MKKAEQTFFNLLPSISFAVAGTIALIPPIDVGAVAFCWGVALILFGLLGFS